MIREWESSVEATGAIVAAAISPGSIPTPPRLQVSPGGGVVVILTHVTPNSNLLGFVHQWY